MILGILIFVVVTGVLLAVLMIVIPERRHDRNEIRKLKVELKDIQRECSEGYEEYKKTSEKINGDLQEKVDDLEKLNKFMVGREVKMIELKENIKELEIALQHALKAKPKRSRKKT